MWYHLNTHFRFGSNNEPSSTACFVRGKKALQEHKEYVLGWLAAHKHTFVRFDVTEMGNKKPF